MLGHLAMYGMAGPKKQRVHAPQPNLSYPERKSLTNNSKRAKRIPS